MITLYLFYVTPPRNRCYQDHFIFSMRWKSKHSLATGTLGRDFASHPIASWKRIAKVLYYIDHLFQILLKGLKVTPTPQTGEAIHVAATWTTTSFYGNFYYMNHEPVFKETQPQIIDVVHMFFSSKLERPTTHEHENIFQARNVSWRMNLMFVQLWNHRDVGKLFDISLLLVGWMLLLFPNFPALDIHLYSYPFFKIQIAETTWKVWMPNGTLL